MNDAQPKEITPASQHPVVMQVSTAIGADMAPVSVKRAEKRRPLGNCYWNAARAAEESGGTTALGWMINWWPNLYGVAIHHAVWKMPNGRLIDVTEPQPFDRNASQTIFVPDSRFKVPLDILPCIDSIHIPLIQSNELEGYFNSYTQREVARREVAKLAWTYGYRAEQCFALAAGQKPPRPPLRPFNPGDSARLAELKREIGMRNKEISDAIKSLHARDASA